MMIGLPCLAILGDSPSLPRTNTRCTTASTNSDHSVPGARGATDLAGYYTSLTMGAAADGS
jgi:hypothetical protein